MADCRLVDTQQRRDRPRLLADNRDRRGPLPVGSDSCRTDGPSHVNYLEEPICFDCAAEALLGILARPEQVAELGVLVVVGGPQTRVGSHRQFVLLSRRLAAAGYASLRFDYRGMGDSTGEQHDFENIEADIGAAIGVFQGACPAVKRVVLWGLCDAAAASLLYWDSTRDQRIFGFCLLNPWVRSEETLARTQVKHYYGQRLLQKQFWTKLFRGQLDILAALRELFSKMKLASARSKSVGLQTICFQDRMARTVATSQLPILLILSGNDYTAKEFLEYTASARSWQGTLDTPRLKRIDIAGADHTFSSHVLRDRVADECVEWLDEQIRSLRADNDHHRR